MPKMKPTNDPATQGMGQACQGRSQSRTRKKADDQLPISVPQKLQHAKYSDFVLKDGILKIKRTHRCIPGKPQN